MFIRGVRYVKNCYKPRILKIIMIVEYLLFNENLEYTLFNWNVFCKTVDTRPYLICIDLVVFPAILVRHPCYTITHN